MRKASGSPRKRERARSAVIAALPKRSAVATLAKKKRAPGVKSKPNGRGGTPRPAETRAAAGTDVRDVRAGRRASERVVQGGRAAAPEPGSTTSRGKYVYCIIEAPDSLRFGSIGLGTDPSDVYTVHYRNLAAVVSDAPLEVLDSTRENVLAHERVNETVMREHTVIPMSFGTIFKTREDIVELLRSAAEAFGDVLNKMQNKLEFGLKVLWDRDQAVREVESDDEDISRLKKEISGQKGPTYFARMQYGRLVDSALQQRSERYVADILDQLRDVSVASRVNKPIGDKMIMNAAFLISRDQENAFDAKVKSIASRFDKLTFKYTGPWPPYNFVNIRLKLERA
jgi:Gas vesicle synthesis protein GvpL/GvpF